MIKMRINGGTRAGGVACCHRVRSRDTLSSSSKALAPLPSSYRLPPFGVPYFGGSILFGCCLFWGAIHFALIGSSLREKLEFDVTVTIFCSVQLLLFTMSYCPPPPSIATVTSELVGRNPSLQAIVCSVWGQIKNVWGLSLCCLLERKRLLMTFFCWCWYWITENKWIGWELTSHRRLDRHWLFI